MEQQGLRAAGIDDGRGAHAGVPTPLQAVAIVTALIPIIAVYLILGSMIGIHALYMGFLFATYWGAVQRSSRVDFIPSLFGALTGIALAAALVLSPAKYGLWGLLPSLFATLVTIYLLTRQQATLFINSAFLLFLTVACVPVLSATNGFTDLAAGTVYGSAYIGVFVLLFARMQRMRERRSTPITAGQTI